MSKSPLTSVLKESKKIIGKKIRSELFLKTTRVATFEAVKIITEIPCGTIALAYLGKSKII